MIVFNDWWLALLLEGVSFIAKATSVILSHIYSKSLTHLIQNFSQTWKYPDVVSLLATLLNNQKLGKVCQKLDFMVSHNCDVWGKAYTKIKYFWSHQNFYIFQPSYFKLFDQILGLLILCIKTPYTPLIGLSRLNYKKYK